MEVIFGGFVKRLLGLSLVVMLLTGCAEPGSESFENTGPKQQTPYENPAVDPSDGPKLEEPDWELTASPSDVEMCKVEDGLPETLLALGRGSWSEDRQARGPVGFPWVSSYFFPPEGQLKMLFILVSFEDTQKFIEQPSDYWNPQGDKLSGWFDFWSRGKMKLDTETHKSWIELPYRSSEAPRSDAKLATDIVDRFDEGINPNDYDAFIIQWAPGIETGTRSKFSLRLNSIDQEDANGFDYRQMVWSTNLDFYRNDYEVRRDNIWGSLVHEILHEMNFNLHGPGNGWGTGVGQSYRANQNGGVSYALTAWEQFLVGWMPESEVHCIEMNDLGVDQEVILTPLEIAEGDRKALIVPISNSDVLVIESRRPVGYSESWDSENQGLLAYTVNPLEEAQKDHIDEDCGNDPTYTKWAYYLFPDQEKEDASAWCGAMGGQFSPAIFNQGETLTHNGVHVELVYSATDKDFIKVSKTNLDKPNKVIDLGPPEPNGGWWNQIAGDWPVELPNPSENFGHTMMTDRNSVPEVEDCRELSDRWGARNGFAASRELKKKAGAAIATFVSTEWYAKNRALDTNLDGVICSCQAPEVHNENYDDDNQTEDCITSQLDSSLTAQRPSSSPPSDSGDPTDSGSASSGSGSTRLPLSQCGERWWIDCYRGSVALPSVAENSAHGKPVDNPDRIGPPNCDGLAQTGITEGIAGSYALRDSASASSAMVSTQWYSKLYELDQNRDGVICSSEAPEGANRLTSGYVDRIPGSPAGQDVSKYSQVAAITRYPRWGMSCSCCCG